MGVGVVPTVPFTCAQQYRSLTQKNPGMIGMFWKTKEQGGTKEGKANSLGVSWSLSVLEDKATLVVCSEPRVPQVEHTF